MLSVKQRFRALPFEPVAVAQEKIISLHHVDRDDRSMRLQRSRKQASEIALIRRVGGVGGVGLIRCWSNMPPDLELERRKKQCSRALKNAFRNFSHIKQRNTSDFDETPVSRRGQYTAFLATSVCDLDPTVYTRTCVYRVRAWVRARTHFCPVIVEHRRSLRNCSHV